MKARTPLIAGNWKMHKTIAQTRAFIAELDARGVSYDGIDALICPPFTALAAARDALADSPLALGAQNMCWAEAGAFTGEVSPLMLAELGIAWVVIGHSERRAMFGDLDERVNEKVRSALAHGITPIVAVGETAQEHHDGQARARVHEQLTLAFAGVPAADAARCVVAYEPIWAIGTGNADSPPEADALMATMRDAVDGLRDVRMLYGGSVKPDNIAAFMAQPNIDGGLVGGASLEAAPFAALLDNARAGASA